MTTKMKVKGRLNELKGRAQQRWAKLTDDDLERAGDTLDELGNKIAARYQLGKEEARKQLDDFLERWNTPDKNSR